jgi:hypothetical protein
MAESDDAHIMRVAPGRFKEKRAMSDRPRKRPNRTSRRVRDLDREHNRRMEKQRHQDEAAYRKRGQYIVGGLYLITLGVVAYTVHCDCPLVGGAIGGGATIGIATLLIVGKSGA